MRVACVSAWVILENFIFTMASSELLFLNNVNHEVAEASELLKSRVIPVQASSPYLLMYKVVVELVVLVYAELAFTSA